MLLFQVGDFYELFADDARRASHVSVFTCMHIYLIFGQFLFPILVIKPSIDTQIQTE